MDECCHFAFCLFHHKGVSENAKFTVSFQFVKCNFNDVPSEVLLLKLIGSYQDLSNQLDYYLLIV